MKTSKLLFLALVTFVLAFSSCKKEEKKFIGKWQGDEFYTNNELDEFNDLFKLFTVEFNEDKTGTYNSLGSQPFTWSYDDDSKLLHIETETIVSGDITIEGDTMNATVTLIDDESLHFTYTDDGDNIEQRFKKVE